MSICNPNNFDLFPALYKRIKPQVYLYIILHCINITAGSVAVVTYVSDIFSWLS